MARTWPFERLAEPVEPFRTPEDFVARRGAGRARPDRKADAGRARPDRKADAGRAQPDRKADAGRARPDRGEIDVTGVIIRIGLCDAQLVLVDREGTWERWVFGSTEEATSVARSLGIVHHVGEYPEEVRQAMNMRARPLEDFTARAYPEQGRVGAVIPYPENRPRRLDEGHHEEEGVPGPHAGVRS